MMKLAGRWQVNCAQLQQTPLKKCVYSILRDDNAVGVIGQHLHVSFTVSQIVSGDHTSGRQPSKETWRRELSS